MENGILLFIGIIIIIIIIITIIYVCRVSPFGSLIDVNRTKGNSITTSTSTYDRQSLVFFSGPRETALIEPLINTDAADTIYKAVRSGDHLRMKLERTQK